MKPPAWVIIADDLTGACDTGATFAGQGWSTRVSLTGVGDLGDAEVWAFNTESREMPGEAAILAVQQTALQHRPHPGGRVFKKIDSTLRGHAGEEMAAIVNVLQSNRALVCPAFPQQGRTVRGSSVYVHGVALGETEFAERPGESDLRELLAACEPSLFLHIDTLRGNADAVTARLKQPGICIADAETTDDLRILAEAGKRAGISLFCGSAGLARALAACDEKTRAEIRIPRSQGPILGVAGSRSKATVAQCEYLETRGTRVVWVSESMPVEHILADLRIANEGDQTIVLSTGKMTYAPGKEKETSAYIAWLTEIMLKNIPAGGMVLTGGDTASSVCRALGCTAIDLYGEVQPGLGWGTLVDGMQPGLPVVTKAGGFGVPDTMMTALTFLQQLHESVEE